MQNIQLNIFSKYDSIKWVDYLIFLLIQVILNK